ncbi:MAG: PadR family transcriptional regulator [Phycisphaerales bacterium]|nr:PadR family transcriptional regulator [Phycisphaerales bacterium]
MPKTAQPAQPEILQGTLDVMILRTLERAETHGYGIARAIERSSGGVLAVEEGSLYPALYRMEKRGDLTHEWKTSELNRRAKFYRLTPSGRKRLVHEVEQWEKLSHAVGRVLAGSAREALA